MNALRCFPSGPCGWLLAAVWLASTPALAVDVTGTYVDKGVAVAQTADLPPQEMSFHGLLNLEFDPQLNRLQFDDTAEIQLEQGHETLELRVIGTDGKLRWQGWLPAQEGRTAEGERVVLLRLRSREKKDEAYLFSLAPLGDGGTLQVTVMRTNWTVFGPSGRLVGIYLFERLH
jgi:hypothetical protein